MGTSRLTILFDDPFWIGLYEREDDTEDSVCRIVFGAEPRDQEVCDSARPGQGQSICPLPKAPSGASGRPGG